MVDFDVETNGLQPWSGKQRAFLYIFGDDAGNTEATKWTPGDDTQAAVYTFGPDDETIWTPDAAEPAGASPSATGIMQVAAQSEREPPMPNAPTPGYRQA